MSALAHEETMEESLSESSPYDILFDVIKNVATERLDSYGDVGLGDAVETGMEDMSYDHWIGEITLCFPSIEIAFRAHFSSKIARLFAVAMLGEDEPVAPLVCHSFMTEFCNLTAGALKNILSDVVSDMDDEGDLGLPERKPSFDMARLDAEEDRKFHSWKYDVADMALVCRASISIDPAALMSDHGLTPEEFATRVRDVVETPPTLDEFDDFLL